MNRVYIQIADNDSGELKHSGTHELDLSYKKHYAFMHELLDNYFKMLKDNPRLSFELHGYLSHEELELPF